MVYELPYVVTLEVMPVSMIETHILPGDLPDTHHTVAAVNVIGTATVRLGIQVKVAMVVTGLALHSIHLIVAKLMCYGKSP